MRILKLMKPFSSFLFAVFLGMALCGCVKERRGLCPCLLRLDLSRLDTALMHYARVNIVGPEGFVYDGLLDAEFFDDEMVIRVPQGDCMLCVYSGEQGLAAPERGLYIPYGRDCPPVYMCASYIDTECEQYRKVVLLRKNYCQLSVCVEDAEHFPFGLAVRGDVVGYGSDGRPVAGDFYCGVDNVAEAELTMSVPRQVDDSMILEVNDGTDVLKTFALGEYIHASGYDWNAADLEDITVGIDYTRTKLTVSVLGWDEVYEFDVVI